MAERSRRAKVTGKRCCRSLPRCATCPLVLSAELRAVEGLDALAPAPEVPPHLAGVPAVLHRYEPLLRRAWEQRQATPAGGPAER